jgi:hypothetical protein
VRKTGVRPNRNGCSAAPRGIGAASVRDWESNGAAYSSFVARMKQLGSKGCRAVLWQQGESDAGQQDATAKLYRQCLEKLIVDSRSEIGWNAPWMVAQLEIQAYKKLWNLAAKKPKISKSNLVTFFKQIPKLKLLI